MTDFKKESLILQEENMFLKDDITFLRQKIELLTKTNCELSVELKLVKSDSMEFKKFSEDGDEAVQELIRILQEKKYTCSSHKEGKYYSVYSPGGNYILVLENTYISQKQGLITTPQPHHKVNDLKPMYEDITSSWEKFGQSPTRKKYDFRGELINEVMDIFNKFD